MKFQWSAEQNAFRAEVRATIQSLLPPDWATISTGGVGSTAQLEFSREFCAQLSARGLLVPHWPAEYGGRAMSPWEQFILAEELCKAGEPRALQYMNVNYIGPTIMHYGTPQQREYHLERIRGGRTLWCQGYSEPNAGSDLAALRTSATRTDQGYIIDGTKIWTSGAQCADFCILLARMGEGKNNICVFLVPMDLPGVTVRDIDGMIPGGGFHEVFFNNVEVPESARLGAEGQAWEIVRYSLQFERIGVPHYAKNGVVLEKLIKELKADGRWSDPLIRARAGRALAANAAAQALTYQVIALRVQGLPPTADVNVARIATVAAQRATTEFIGEVAPQHLSGGISEIEGLYRHAIATPIAAGATEVQLDIVAQSFLKLPRHK
jgi:alkylation response protein AidB-like acyl-CoA dehydrogenase